MLLQSNLTFTKQDVAMSRTVQCVKLNKEAPGLEYPPYPGEMGVKIWQSISQEAWEEWKANQTRLVNENRLNLADTRARKYLKEQMQKFLFEGGDIEAQGYVPPSE
jgi:Fe-S cluster biosynthesis and repair protein YggX